MAAMLHSCWERWRWWAEVVIWPVVPQPPPTASAQEAGYLNKVITWSPTALYLSFQFFLLPICHLFVYFFFLFFHFSDIPYFPWTLVLLLFHICQTEAFQQVWMTNLYLYLKLGSHSEVQRCSENNTVNSQPLYVHTVAYLLKGLGDRIKQHDTPQPWGPKNRRQVHSSQNFALEPATADISSYSRVSVGVSGMLLILCWHGCSYSMACWNRRVCMCVFGDGQRLS